MKPERIKSIRVEMGHTLESLGELIGADSKAVWRWESGKNVPDAESLGKLAQALHTNSDYLLGFTDDPAPIGLDGNLTLKERIAISEWRKGDKIKAIKSIIEDA